MSTVFNHLTPIKTESLYDHISDLHIKQTQTDHHNDPSNTQDLGMHSSKSTTVTLENIINSTNTSLTDEYTFEQSISNLNNAASSTGFVLWKISIPFLNWLLTSSFYSNLIHDDNKFILELGSGVSGLFPCFIGKVCGGRYIATDQYHLLKLLKKNIKEGLEGLGVESLNSMTIDHIINKYSTTTNRKRKNKVQAHNNGFKTPTIDAICYDWENIEQGQYELTQLTNKSPDLILGCDIVYNDYLVPHLVNAILSLCGEHTIVLIGLQLRLLENIELFLETLLNEGFEVYSHDETCLTKELNEGGFVIYYIRRKREEGINNVYK